MRKRKTANVGLVNELIAQLTFAKDANIVVFTPLGGLGPIDIVRVNIHTGKVDFYDAKSDRDRSHHPRPFTELQKKLGVKQFYVNRKKRTFRLKEIKNDKRNK